MAKSKSFFGLRTGSTKNFTFAINAGKQITKERVESVKNPRTEAQMRQRMLMTTIGAGYKFMKSICDHSFEGKTAGQACMSEFMRLNLLKFKADAADNSMARAFNAYQDADFNPIPYIVSKGSLEPVPYNVTDQRAVVVSVTAPAEIKTAEDVYNALGIQTGDLLTFCYTYGEANITDGVYYYTPEGFNVVRLNANKSGNIAKLEDAFEISTNRAAAEISMVLDGATATITSGAADIGCVILSRKANGVWLRSDATMQGQKSIIGGVSVANQLRTYPIGSELILNNGEMNNQNTTSALPAPKLSISPTSVTITTNGGTAAIPTLTGAPAGAAISYGGYDNKIISIANGQITAKGNGTTSVNVNVAATDTTSGTSIKFQVTCSGQTTGGGDGGDSDIE